MDDRINIRFEYDPEHDKPQVIIRASEKNELVENIIKSIEQYALGNIMSKIVVQDRDKEILIEINDIIRIYTESRKLKVRTMAGVYEVRGALRDLEDRLDKRFFARISRAEIVNIKRISGFDLSITGTIHVSFEDGSETWVARRFVKDLQKRLSFMRRGGEYHE
ncbi:LytTr DNA-binding domain-containing protein [Butyrivibrio sp. ob235]|uniref:LytTR family DNA-binding domain-containing protein n=1 Tax=Butyrivibrio sp. ob235 TaxID=1761780 RepID=UPI0008B057DD|nr:LytTR family DNA-binding domain-containing protein [Butyrivibrio sp. ob235]SEL07066.1 LytTr DNA-binding domain-containing protein [Butyrivibrio sp. ob235]